jgi:predicted nicotinamide N-methyase
MNSFIFFAPMPLTANIQQFSFGATTLKVYVPDAIIMQQWYTQMLQQNANAPSPYWSQVWPAAKALCQFLANEPHWVNNKTVLELAAGLGLPSMLSAQWAHSIMCSDYIPEAVEMMRQSISLMQLKNIEATLLDWNQLPANLGTEVLLLSDINYEPAAFANILGVIEQFLQAGTTILLSTPQRLMAKPFIAQLLSYCILQQETIVTDLTPHVVCSIMVLQKTKAPIG